jgi:hypothetical protein
MPRRSAGVHVAGSAQVSKTEPVKDFRGAGLVSGKGGPACLTRVGVLRLVEPTAFRADAVRPAGRVAGFLMPGGWR